METLKTIDSSIISIIILIFIYINAYDRSERVFMDYKLFIALVQTNMALIIIDILGWVFNGLSGSFNMISNKGFNLLLYIVEPIGPMLWIFYTNFQVFQDEERIRKLKHILLIFFAINAIASIMSLYTGWFFSVNAKNIYRRGDYFWIHVLFCYVLLIYSFIFILINRSKIETKYYYSMLLYFLPQAVGTTIQVFVYGVSFNWSGMMLSLLIIYFNIQNRSLNTDYLTGLYNRRQLDSYLKAKIRNSSDEKSFSAILIDLNKFKYINDMFGHDVGDEALQDTVEIIRECVRQNDFVARFGGDEFFIIMDIHSRGILEEGVERIKDTVEKFNKNSKKPYELSFCMGYDVYDHKTKMKADDFFKHIDMLMYNNKNSRC